MAFLTTDDAHAFGRALALAFHPRTVSVSVKRPPVERHEQYTEYETQTSSREVVVDAGPQGWTYAVLPAGALFGGLLWAVTGAFIGLLALLVAGGAFAFAFRTFRKTETREEVVEEEVPVTRERIVLVESPDASEERHVPAATRVLGLGRVDLEFLSIPVGSGTLLIDPGRAFPATRLNVRLPRSATAVGDDLEALRALTDEVPAVLTGDAAEYPLRQATSFGAKIRLTGTERQLWEGFDRLEKLLRVLPEEAFEVSVVPARHPVAPLLRRRDGPPSSLGPGSDAARALLEGLRRARRVEALLRSAAVDLPARHAALAGTRLVALRKKVGPMCHNLGQVFHYSAFHFYCPECNAEIQKDLLGRDYSVQGGSQCAPVTYSRATLLGYDPSGPGWRCPQCEGRFPMDAVIPIHRMLDEVFLPVYDRLMEENKTERLRIYSDSRNRELDFRNQLDRDMDTLVHNTRTSLELVSDEVRRLEAEIAGEREALGAFAAIMESHAAVRSGALAQIEQSAREIEARVQAGVEAKLRDMDVVFSRERALVGATMDKLSRSKRLDDEKRDAVQRQIAASTLDIAQTSRRIEQHTERAAMNTERIAASSERAAVAGERAAAAAERTASTGDALLEGQKQGNAIMGAMAKRMGVSAGPSGWDLVGQAQHGLADLASNVLLESDTERSRRHQEIPR
jgi:hypothetical protein